MVGTSRLPEEAWGSSGTGPWPRPAPGRNPEPRHVSRSTCPSVSTGVQGSVRGSCSLSSHHLSSHHGSLEGGPRRSGGLGCTECSSSSHKCPSCCLLLHCCRTAASQLRQGARMGLQRPASHCDGGADSPGWRREEPFLPGTACQPRGAAGRGALASLLRMAATSAAQRSRLWICFGGRFAS